MNTAPTAAATRASAAERWLLASGVAFAIAKLGVLVYFGVSVASKWPPFDAPAVERALHYAAHWEQIQFANFLLPLPTPLFLLFLGGLFSVLRRAEGGTGALSVTAFGAGIAAAMVWPIGMVLGALAMQIGKDGGDLVTMQVLEGIAPLSLALSALPRAVLLAAAALVVLQTRCAPRWVGWWGIGLAPFSLAGAATLLMPAVFPLLGLGMPLFLLWVLAFSVGALWTARHQVRAKPLPEPRPAKLEQVV